MQLVADNRPPEMSWAIASLTPGAMPKSSAHRMMGRALGEIFMD
jgi:hypothetical protein